MIGFKPRAPGALTVAWIIEQATRHSVANDMSPVRHISLWSEKRRRTGALWNPSALSWCKRKSVYKACGVKPATPEVDLRQQFTFDRGHVVGAWLAAYLRAAEDAGVVSNVHCQCRDRDEMLVLDDETRLGGFIDVFFTYDGRNYVIEVKSKDTNSAMEKIAPSKEHQQQNQDYANILLRKGVDVELAFLVYVGLVEIAGKQTLKIVEFPYKPSPAAWAETERQTRMLKWFYDDPDQMPPGSDRPFMECGNCAFQGPCKRGLTPAQAVAEQNAQLVQIQG